MDTVMIGCSVCGWTVKSKGLCHRCYNKAWAASHRESEKARALAHYYANRDAKLALAKIYRQTNLEVIKERNRRYTERHTEERRDYRQRRTKERALYMAEWRARNPGKQSIYESNRRARKYGGGGTHTPEEVSALYKKQKGCCPVCRVDLAERYHKDHVQPLVLGGSNGIANIQLLCRQCNQSKHTKDPIRFMQQRGFLL